MIGVSRSLRWRCQDNQRERGYHFCQPTVTGYVESLRLTECDC